MQYDNNNTIILSGSPTSWMTYDDNADGSDNVKATVIALKKTSIEKSKRKQVKNACGKNINLLILIHVF